MIKDAFRGIGITAYNRVLRRPDTIARVTFFLEHGNDKKSHIIESAVLGPYTTGPNPLLVGSNPPILNVGANETVSVDQVVVFRTGLLGRKATVQAHVYPVEKPSTENLPTRKNFFPDPEPVRKIDREVTVVFSVVNHRTAEENLRDIVRDVRPQIWRIVPTTPVVREGNS